MRYQWLATVASVPTVMVAPAYAVTYFSPAEVQQKFFPEAAQFVSKPVVMDAALRRKIEQQSQARFYKPVSAVKALDAAGKHLGWVLIDNVIGKHDFITYAVSLSTQGTIQGIEILNYRESYGGQVRNQGWRGQFVGKTMNQPIKVHQDIKNISGATLSCVHVADGVRKLLALHQQVLQAL